MPQPRRKSELKKKVAKAFFVIIFMSMMLMAEGIISGHGSISSSYNLIESSQADMSHATKVLHFVVSLLTYSL